MLLSWFNYNIFGLTSSSLHGLILVIFSIFLQQFIENIHVHRRIIENRIYFDTQKIEIEKSQSFSCIMVMDI